jgi:hypothetical protein
MDHAQEESRSERHLSEMLSRDSNAVIASLTLNDLPFEMVPLRALRSGAPRATRKRSVLDRSGTRRSA